MKITFYQVLILYKTNFKRKLLRDPIKSHLHLKNTGTTLV
jgi:hypothetical protein